VLVIRATYEFIKTHRNEFGVQMPRADVAASGYTVAAAAISNRAQKMPASADPCLIAARDLRRTARFLTCARPERLAVSTESPPHARTTCAPCGYRTRRWSVGKPSVLIPILKDSSR
jgi:hypothetical protein